MSLNLAQNRLFISNAMIYRRFQPKNNNTIIFRPPDIFCRAMMFWFFFAPYDVNAFTYTFWNRCSFHSRFEQRFVDNDGFALRYGRPIRLYVNVFQRTKSTRSGLALLRRAKRNRTLFSHRNGPENVWIIYTYTRHYTSPMYRCVVYISR